MKRITDKTLKESVFFARADGGIEVYVWPKRGLRKKFALAGVRYGSADSRVLFPGEKTPADLPEGIAHFLEHSLFVVRGKDLSDEFSRLGASVNATTSFSDTTYFFSCTENFDKAARLLLALVGRPVFDEQRVARERQIIAQEISMSKDSPDWRLFFGLMQALYKNHPVRVDIGGTAESVARIDGAILRRCHETFYRPDNMIFVAAGDLVPEKVLEVVNSAARRTAGKKIPPATRLHTPEPAAPYKKSCRKKMTVSRPKILLGFKDRPADLDPRERFRRLILTGVLIDAVFGSTSELYNDLYKSGLADETFGASYTAEADFGHTVVGGDTDKPEALKRAIFEGIAKIRRRGLDDAAFRRKKRKALGTFLRYFNSAESCASAFGYFVLRGVNMFDYLPVLLGLDVADAEKRLREHLRPDACATSVILPNGAARK